MSYIPSLKLLLKFDNNELFENVSYSYLDVYLNQTISVYDDIGYVMQESQYIGKSNINFYITNKFSMSFWLHPANPGIVDNDSLEMPVFSIVRAGSPAIYLYEKTLADNKNYLTMDITNIDNPSDPYDPPDNLTYSVSTPDTGYDASVWHHFFIVYNTTTMTIYIDGKSVTTTEIGSLPSSVNGYGYSDFYINKNKTNTFTSTQTYNSGYIDDIAIFNEAYGTAFLQDLINNSIDYVINAEYSDNKEKQFGILFDDPTTVKITSMIDDMSYIFIARNDGKIFRGSPLFWKTRKVYSNEDELDVDILNESIVVNQDADAAAQEAARASLTDGGANDDPDGFIHIKKSLIGL